MLQFWISVLLLTSYMIMLKVFYLSAVISTLEIICILPYVVVMIKLLANRCEGFRIVLNKYYLLLQTKVRLFMRAHSGFKLPSQSHL